MCTLDTLIFCNNSLKSVNQRSVNTLLDAFKKNYRLAVIRMSLNQIASPLAARIFSSVTGSSTLKTLDLSDNVIGDAGLETIVEFLVEARHVSIINLENNRVSDKGMLHICRGKFKLILVPNRNVNAHIFIESQNRKNSTDISSVAGVHLQNFIVFEF